jgi:hypothetical protein
VYDSHEVRIPIDGGKLVTIILLTRITETDHELVRETWDRRRSTLAGEGAFALSGKPA